MNILIKNISALLELIYPAHCIVCKKVLNNNEKEICIHCLFQLPETGFWNIPANPMAKMLWGRIHIEQACSLFFYYKGSSYDNLLFAIKYQGACKIAKYLGNMLGTKIRQANTLKNIDAIIPVPLHRKRERRRGYNQSTHFGKGLSDILNTKVEENLLVRLVNTESQTTKSREERRKNVESAFGISHRNTLDLNNKHILLVDDVFTTGATLEACSSALIQAFPSIKISIATIAYAVY